jgi:hypothetical protein
VREWQQAMVEEVEAGIEVKDADIEASRQQRLAKRK